MWRTTRDVKWSERGYGIFQAIEKHAPTRFGYTTVRGIDGPADRLLFNNFAKVYILFITFFFPMS